MTDTKDVSGSDATRLDRRLKRLIEAADELTARAEQRREALLESAESDGVDRPVAEQAYDIAEEEGLPPAWGLALVRSGIGVAQLHGANADVETSEPAEPEWIDEPPDPSDARRERQLRATFRRLRGALEGSTHAREAAARFAREPDLEPVDY